MFYDQLLTVEDELDIIWRRQMSPSSWLFLANRFTLVIGVVEFVLTKIDPTVRAQPPQLCLATLIHSFQT